MKFEQCPVCDFARAEEREYADVVEQGRRRTVVAGLRHFVCPECDAVFSNAAQSRRNLVRTQLALNEEPRFLAPGAIVQLRERLCLTQRECARLFGGGTNAFSKYENGEVTQSEPMDNLLWLAGNYPGVVGALAQRRGVKLNDKAVARCGGFRQPTSYANEQTVAGDFITHRRMTYHIGLPWLPLIHTAEQEVVYSVDIGDAANEGTFNELQISVG